MAIWSCCLSDKPSLQDLLEVQKHFGLPSPALVEKDWYVVKALAALVAVDAAPFRLVFGGGTALSRAHRLIRRMSEDIDLKIISDTTITRPALRHLRDIITKALMLYMICTCSAGTMISLRLRSWHERSYWRMPQLMAINSRLTAQTLSPRPCGPLPALWLMLDLPGVIQRSSATWFMARAPTSRLRSARLRLWQKALRQ
jgi:hypothetical protein